MHLLFVLCTKAVSITTLAFSLDGRYYVTSRSGDRTAQGWRATSGVEVARITHDDVVTSVDFSLDGKYIVSGSEDGTARVWDATSGIETSDESVNGLIPEACKRLPRNFTLGEWKNFIGDESYQPTCPNLPGP